MNTVPLTGYPPPSRAIMLFCSIKTVEQIERRGISILSIIPAIGSESKKNKTKKYISNNRNVKNMQRRLITHENPKSPVSEAYRSLRTSLMYTKKENQNNCRMILVSSPGPGEGKTTTISNLAITYANLGKKTLSSNPIDSLRKVGQWFPEEVPTLIVGDFNVERRPPLSWDLRLNSRILVQSVI